ncbi:hypothetical protein EVAR_81703_1 [Eumeta japonica]|uniref:Uncharacterized protein n=1 Tax=Eumeta variegata TaxID=151549 RepID=A0A4C1V291_EUMVA|nr:hypothetical protein EVAR_81703_1 [Eumeta japonica]
MGPPDGGRPIPFRKITNWKRVSTALEKIDTPNLNSIPNDIASTDEIDLTIGALTNHVRTVVEERAGGSGILGSPEVSADILELIRAKTQLCAARAYPTPEYRSRAQALQREVARVRESEMRVGATSWRKSNHPQSVLGKAIDDAEIAECLADSIETQCSHASLRTTSLISVASRKRFSKTSLEPKDDLAPVSLSEVQTLGIHKPGNHATSCQLQTDQPPERSGQTIRKFKTRLSDHLLGKGLIIDEQFGFQPILAGVPQGSTLSLLYSAYTNDVPRPSSSVVQLALFADDTALFTEIGIEHPIHPPPPEGH